MEAPHVSVIMAVYNGGPHLEPAVRSILSQDLQALELIAVDDGSSDGSRDVLTAMAGADERLRPVFAEHAGLIATLNRAIDEARAPIIARLDHDDVAAPSRLTKQLGVLNARPRTVAVGCNLQRIDAAGEPVSRARPQRARPRAHDPVNYPPSLTFLPGPTLCARADVLRQAGRFREAFVAAEDRDLCWRLGERGDLVRLDEALVAHRVHGENMSVRRRDRQIISHVLSDFSAIARHFGRDDAAILAAVDLSDLTLAPIEAYITLLSDVYAARSYWLSVADKQGAHALAGYATPAAMKTARLKAFGARALRARGSTPM
ncbi:MAG: glycosyltransferase family A protein [Pseudomonadota bacterium]